ncbi:MAG: lipoate--protein ligase family protein, partial [Chlamydiia bacterium]|nr:lipoate--protein ligase family protein [Chlamydiia bacterium]
MKLLHLKNVPILEQLCLEEALLRTDKENWLILNSGSTPAVVFGISGKVEEHLSHVVTLPLIRRFSGGGTVVVDEETLFATVICNESDAGCKPFPHEILHYVAGFYEQILPEGFAARENDFTLHGRKFGGNAQCIVKGRWLHHSTLLWDYCTERMSLLKMPPKMPTYRQMRPHSEFLTTLKTHFADKADFMSRLKEAFGALEEISQEEALALSCRPHRKATHLISHA